MQTDDRQTELSERQQERIRQTVLDYMQDDRDFADVPVDENDPGRILFDPMTDGEAPWTGQTLRDAGAGPSVRPPEGGLADGTPDGEQKPEGPDLNQIQLQRHSFVSLSRSHPELFPSYWERPYR